MSAIPQPDTFAHLVGLGVLKSGWVCLAPGDSYTGLGGSSPWITQGLQAMGLVQYSSWSQVTDKNIDPVRFGVKLVHGTETDAMVSWAQQLGTRVFLCLWYGSSWFL